MVFEGRGKQHGVLVKRSDCLGLQVQLHHLLANWPLLNYLTLCASASPSVNGCNNGIYLIGLLWRFSELFMKLLQWCPPPDQALCKCYITIKCLLNGQMFLCTYTNEYYSAIDEVSLNIVWEFVNFEQLHLSLFEISQTINIAINTYTYPIRYLLEYLKWDFLNGQTAWGVRGADRHKLSGLCMNFNV